MMNGASILAPCRSHVHRARTVDAFAAILDPDVNLAIWDRPSMLPVGSLDGFGTIQMTTTVDRARAALTDAFAQQPAAPGMRILPRTSPRWPSPSRRSWICRTS